MTTAKKSHPWTAQNTPLVASVSTLVKPNVPSRSAQISCVSASDGYVFRKLPPPGAASPSRKISLKVVGFGALTKTRSVVPPLTSTSIVIRAGSFSIGSRLACEAIAPTPTPLQHVRRADDPRHGRPSVSWPLLTTSGRENTPTLGTLPVRSPFQATRPFSPS